MCLLSSRLRSLFILPVLVVVFSGCAAAPEEAFRPTAAHDPGPWPVEQHDSLLQGYWISFGPYRSNRNLDASVKSASETGIEQVNFKVVGPMPRVFELHDAYGEPIYFASGISLDDNAHAKGLAALLKTPESYSGTVASGGTPIAEYRNIRIEKGTLGFGEKWRELLTVGPHLITVQQFTEPSPHGPLDIFGEIAGTEYLDEAGVRLATLRSAPRREIWIDNSLPRDVQATIAVHAADRCVVEIELENAQQAANRQIVISRLAAP